MSKTQRRSLTEAAAKKAHVNPHSQVLLQCATQEARKQVHAYIPISLHTRFKVKAAMNGRKMNDILHEMIVRYVNE